MEGQNIQWSLVPTSWLEEITQLVKENNRMYKERSVPVTAEPYTIIEAAKLFKVTTQTIYDWIYKDTWRAKKGIKSVTQTGKEYVIMIDESQFD